MKTCQSQNFDPFTFIEIDEADQHAPDLNGWGDSEQVRDRIDHDGLYYGLGDMGILIKPIVPAILPLGINTSFYQDENEIFLWCFY